MDKEFIEQIKSQLKGHEEAYTPGAWERFAEKDRKRRGFAYWPLWTAAAVLLVFLGLLFRANQTGKKTEIALSKPNIDTVSLNKKPLNAQLNISKPNRNGISSALKATESANASNLNNRSTIPVQTTLGQEKIFQNALNSKTTVTLSNNHATIQATNVTGTNPQEKQEATPAHPLTFEDLLAQDSKTKPTKTIDKSIKNSKWESGIYVAPAMGNDSKVNLNYGFSLSYAVANKLSISSGVSYASLSSSETLSNSSPQALSGKNLGAITAKVSGINIPLELRYKISDRLYTGVGVSALAVLNNSQNNTYLSNNVQSFASPSSAQTADIKYIVQEKTVEPQPPASVAPDNYIGFYNFSVGYRQKISKKNNISIEPFLQLPMKTFSKENLNLTNGGVRLKFDF
ncbi:hypothetical protein ABIB40_003003 [Pedobacter sp. UYP30]|uniref:hypothetical protein n=1 Tax=Pedobacter sp. UYP30 TaxID=1756400 RepID=UPI00339591D3